MPRLVKANQSTASRRRVYFHLVSGADGVTPATGEAGGQPQVSVDGGAWSATGIGTLAAIGNGRYYADLTQSLVATAGAAIETRYKSASTAESPGDSVQVVAFDPADGSGLAPVTVGTNNDKAGYSLTQAFPANFATLTITSGQTIGTSTYAGADTGGTTTLLGRLTAARAGYLDKLDVVGTLAHTGNAAQFQADVSGLMTAAAYTAPDNAGIATAASNATAAANAAASAETAANNVLGAAQGAQTAAQNAETAATNVLGAATAAETAALAAKASVDASATLTDMVDAFIAAVERPQGMLDQVDVATIDQDAVLAFAYAVWQHATRTLTSYPASMSTAVPMMGVGLFAAGARSETQPLSYRGAVLEGQSVALLARMVDVSGDYVAPLTTLSVTSAVLDTQAGGAADAVSHEPEDVVFDSLILNARWTEDAIGYNVAVPIAGSRLSNPNTIYRVTLTVTDTQGQTSVARWDVQT